MKIKKINEIATLNDSVLPTQLITADKFYYLEMFLVQG